MNARIISLAVPIVALLVIGGTATVPGLVMKWQLRDWASLLDNQREVLAQYPVSIGSQQPGAHHAR